MQEHEIERVQQPKAMQRPLLTHEQDITYKEPESKNIINDLPDYEESPGYPPVWMKKLQDDRAVADGELWYIDSGNNGGPAAHDYAKYFSSQILKAQESGAGVKFENKRKEETEQPESIPDSKDSSYQYGDSAEEKQPHEANTTLQVDYKQQPHSNPPKHQPASIAKMIQSPPASKTSHPKRLTTAQLAWERDPRPYKGPRPQTPKHHSLLSPLGSPPPRPSPVHPAQIPHASPYCAPRTTAAPLGSPFLHPPFQHPTPLGQSTRPIVVEIVQPNAEKKMPTTHISRRKC